MVCCAALAAPAQTNRVPLTPQFLNQLAEEARTNHPGLLAARARVRAAEKGTQAVKTWEDPMLMAGGMTAREMMREEDGDILFGVEQMLPLTGKPQAERAMARAEEKVQSAAQEYRFQTLRKEIAQTAIRAALAEEIAAISAEDQGWLDTIASTTTERYRGGAGSQVEVLRIQAEQEKRRVQLHRETSERNAELLKLNRLLNRPLETEWPALALPELAPKLTVDARVLDVAERTEPKLRMMRHEIAAAEASAETARRARRPDFSIALQGRQYSGDGDFRSAEAMLKMTLPIGNRSKYRAAFEREKERASAAEFERAEYAAELREEISGLGLRIENARREALVYKKEVLPRAEQALAAATSAWQSGRGMLLETLDARRMLLDARSMYARVVAEQQSMLSELVLCCGLADFDALENFFSKE